MGEHKSPYTILFMSIAASTALSALTYPVPEGQTYARAVSLPDFPGIAGPAAIDDGEDIPQGAIAYHPVFGSIIYGRTWWGFSTRDFIRRLKTADADPRVAAHLIHVDSCGGEAFGCHEAFEAVRDLTKPCWAVCESMCASAAYYLACAADRVLAISPHSQLGSIGTMCTMFNDSEWLRQNGFKELEYYSNLSSLKNKVFNDALDGRGDEFVSRFLDPLAAAFIADVASVRRSVEEGSDAFRGEVYYAGQAQELGLIDGIQPLDSALEQLAALVKPKEPSVNINQINFSLQ